MSQFRQIDITEAKAIIDKGNITIVDIRDPESFREAHIENAISLTEENLEWFVKNADKNKPLICYCYLGNTSQGAAQFFCEQGFKDTYSIMGGFEEWRAVYPTVQ